jgi:ubiquinone biosynthesis protein UbiJ
MKLRAFLYWLARVLGDLNAVRKGDILKRWMRRKAGHYTQTKSQQLFHGKKKLL